MRQFSSRSFKKLSTAHPALQELFTEVLQWMDCIILEGHRSKELQEIYYHSKRSKLMWPESKHNKTPSLAVDVAPYPINWEDKERFYFFGGLVKGIATQLGIDIRWGGDWDRDNNFSDQSFMDLPHFELVGEQYVDNS